MLETMRSGWLIPQKEETLRGRDVSWGWRRLTGGWRSSLCAEMVETLQWARSRALAYAPGRTTCGTDCLDCWTLWNHQADFLINQFLSLPTATMVIIVMSTPQSAWDNQSLQTKPLTSVWMERRMSWSLPGICVSFLPLEVLYLFYFILFLFWFKTNSHPTPFAARLQVPKGGKWQVWGGIHAPCQRPNSHPSMWGQTQRWTSDWVDIFSPAFRHPGEQVYHSNVNFLFDITSSTNTFTSKTCCFPQLIALLSN